jgi:hypothetical protein
MLWCRANFVIEELDIGKLNQEAVEIIHEA